MSKIDDILGKIESYEYTREELLKLKLNAIRARTWGEEGKNKLLAAIEYALEHMPVDKNRKTDREVIIDKGDYKISRGGRDGGNLARLEAIAMSLSKVPGISDMTILKTQIRIYLYGKHFFAGLKSTANDCWISCREDHGVSEETISAWGEIGVVEKSKNYDKPCIGLRADSPEKLAAGIAAVQFI
ncbi:MULTISPECIES: hypothetical protein [Thalassolituus]|jgi:hypothetical protein|uniref:hypothetical protein n=1 Tax=Thalassolituus TaxID=187492 RepID=UPI000C6C25B0|nr:MULTISPECIES: hypothetical protein [Thalassolituus]MAX85689.1 hypothetical protein [Oceanospirillaceae bacterium]MEE3209905.1 hypothetical protein [Pseudomonadota bacterium]TPD55886.1 MAG: hypothetical protein C9355_00950 [Thalassolituus maritimus]|tara:strand:- start:810 stop:1367 length:558 start_codon:yes stop_codon:yes gene_type:complete